MTIIISKKIFSDILIKKYNNNRINAVRIHQLFPNFAKYNNTSFQGKNDVKVSVILPIYNQEKYLAKALNSLQSQTLGDTEFICVNDGSKDNSLKILEDYAGKDTRVKIINQENQGSGIARNNGLKAANGEFVAFLDPDDWYDKNALEVLYAKAKKQNCDMVVFNYKRINEAGEVVRRFNLRDSLKDLYDISPDENFSWRDIKQNAILGLLLMAWNKIYNHDFIREKGLHFSKCSLAEDNVFSIGATLSAQKIGYSPNDFYNYLRHENSAIKSRSDKNLCIFKAIDAVRGLLIKLGLSEELKQEFDDYVVKLMFWHAKQIASQDKLRELCAKKLTPIQNQMLTEQNIL